MLCIKHQIFLASVFWLLSLLLPWDWRALEAPVKNWSSSWIALGPMSNWIGSNWRSQLSNWLRQTLTVSALTEGNGNPGFPEFAGTSCSSLCFSCLRRNMTGFLNPRKLRMERGNYQICICLHFWVMYTNMWDVYVWTYKNIWKAYYIISLAVIRHHNQSKLYTEEFISTYGSRGIRLHHDREPWRQE